ncbi:MAG: DUF3794 domain-containing protein [Ruminococcaceae bacterium]|nr:DUF3794 domain-containing protein [Oscillospiraceae bacterium]
MDFRVSETAYTTCEAVVNAVSEQPVDGDFILPEYCPDVASVLKCHLTTTVQSRQMSGDRLTMEGTVGLRVLYLDEDRRCVRVCEFSQPFSTAFSLPPLTNKAFFYWHTETDYVNCRAVSPRRLDIHGAFTVTLTVMDTVEHEVIAAVEGDGVYTRRTPLTCTVPAAFQEKPFTVSEVLELGGDRHPAETMVYTAVTPRVSECKVLQNKAIVKGALQVCGLYVTDAVNGTMEEATAEIPFSQIVDMEGLSEEWLCDAMITVTASEVHVESSQGGDNTLLSVSAKLLCRLYGWRLESVDAVCDAYSARCPLQMENYNLPTMRLNAVHRDEVTVRQTCDLPTEDVQDISGVWCTVLSVGMTGDGDSMKLDGRLLWCMLAEDGRGEVAYYERTEPFSVSLADGGRDDKPQVTVCHTACQMLGNGKVEMRTTLAVTRRPTSTAAYTVPRTVTADETAAYPPDKAALKIVYAEKGESLWEIARRSRTAVEAIMEENHLTEDVLSADTVLMIPLS